MSQRIEKWSSIMKWFEIFVNIPYRKIIAFYWLFPFSLSLFLHSFKPRCFHCHEPLFALNSRLILFFLFRVCKYNDVQHIFHAFKYIFRWAEKKHVGERFLHYITEKKNVEEREKRSRLYRNLGMYCIISTENKLYKFKMQFKTSIRLFCCHFKYFINLAIL